MENAENPLKSRQNSNLIKMKNYKKVQMVAKNAPSGSYAAGCPSKDRKAEHFLVICTSSNCINCERTA